MQPACLERERDMRNIRVLALAALSVAALGSAHASSFTFEFNSIGKYSTSGSTLTVVDPTVVYDASTIKAKSVTYSYTIPGAATSGAGVITLIDNSTIDFSFNGNITAGVNSDALSGNVVSFSNGTGSLAGYTGNGSISNTTWKNGNDQTTFVAELQAVPEPASMAVLGVGLAGVIARRRRTK